MKATREAALAAIGATVLPLLTALPASAGPKLPVSFEIATVSCPLGAVNISIATAPEEAKLRLNGADFTASVGRDVPLKDARKLCQLILIPHFAVPSTWALKRIESRGTANLEPGVTGEVANRYWIQGNAPAREISHTIEAPTRSWYFDDETPLEFAPCGQSRSLSLGTRLQVESSDVKGAGSVSLNSPDGGITYTLVYKPCQRS
ncbi:DUF4360 domain-containing protein [Actinomadura terrae]|uniref:DUF4360 domain-containing protein n=1 Tax=Actinomadura terrae TaxID=604353 RepID=UPI001FA78DE7|nr:DUF4360 domain-containing protein [Actinomadura terrae]